MTRVVIVGAGVAGLAVAHALRRESPQTDIVVLEARARPGGNIRSEIIEGYLCENGPTGFLDSAPETLALVNQIGLSDRLLRSSDKARRRFIFHRGRLHEVPTSARTFVNSGLLSAMGKLRVMAEPLARSRPERDESIYDFAARRIGHEAAEVMIGSLVSGVFAGDAHGLSLRACFPAMWEMETEYRSLFRALWAKRNHRRRTSAIGSPVGTLTSFTGGMEDLVRALVTTLGDRVRTNTSATALWERGRHGSGLRPVGARSFTVVANDWPIEADAVVLAGPSSDSADLVRPFDPALASVMSSIPTAPLAVVCLGYDRRALAAEGVALNGSGFLVPREAGPRILGALWETSIYSGRAPVGKVLLRVMIGGATDPGAMDFDDQRLIDLVRADLRQTMRLGNVPEFAHVIRHRRGIPQYTIGHGGRLARLDTILQRHPGLFLAGSSYRGVAINSCIEAAPRVAADIAHHLRREPFLSRHEIAAS